ncbi:hypothetical protein AB7G19_22270 [Bradyrhizobium sp. 215_C5_N1_1]|uniref:hypothetical protein n=1 Tax=unclassified Bradyrhizobium TaxID=2631580 RepID=UPI003F8AD3F3
MPFDPERKFATVTTVHYYKRKLSLMELPAEYLIRLAAVLDDLRLDQALRLKKRYIERAFGGAGAIAIAEVEAFARAYGCAFRYNRATLEGVFHSVLFVRRSRLSFDELRVREARSTPS